MPNLVRCTDKRYHVKRITDGAYADLRVTADKSGWSWLWPF